MAKSGGKRQSKAGSIEMAAADVKERLRARHPATIQQYPEPLPGPWTVIEEFEGIDLLAISANKTPPSGAQRDSHYAWVGYEVKVSRSDLRRELLEPGKRYIARRLCHEFYFAVPKGLLTEEELAFEQPDFVPKDYLREPCPNHCERYSKRRYAINVIGANTQTGRMKDVDTSLGELVSPLPNKYNPQRHEPREPRLFDGATRRWETCEACDGKGYLAKSRVELEAPTLWVPPDVGLVEVTAKQCKVVRKSPIFTPQELSPAQLGALARWVSLRPDPRHDGVIQGLADQRKRYRDYEAGRVAAF